MVCIIDKGATGMTYVGFCSVNSEHELRQLIERFDRSTSYYFLRWVHRVSGMVASLPEGTLSPDGQVFNTAMELRWKACESGFEVLLLSTQGEEEGFQSMGNGWRHDDRPVLLNGLQSEQKNLRYSNGFIYAPEVKQKQIGQRYFQNLETLAVQFISLTVNG